MKRFLTLLLSFICFTGYVSAQQKLKYKEVYEIIKQGKDDVSFSTLCEYQKYDTANSNSNWQLALICHKWAMESDPLTQTQDIVYYIERARMYYRKADSLANEKDVKRFREYYSLPAVADNRKIEVTDVKNDIKQRLENLSAFSAQYRTLVNSYNISVGYYDFCFQTYSAINRKYSLLNDIYLDGSQQLINQLDLLADKFDSCLILFDIYKQNLKTYPVKKYDQIYTLKKIEIYRLHGLTPVNFLENKLELWNYKQWVTDVKKVMGGDIKNMQENLFTLDNYIKTAQKQLTDSANFVQAHRKVEIDENLYFRFGKYDPNPYVFKIIRLNKQKYDLLARYYKPELDTLDTLYRFNFAKRVKYAGELLVSTATLSNDFNIFKKNIPLPENIKYTLFFQQQYNGVAGLQRFCDAEIENLKNLTNFTINRIHKFLILDLFNTDSVYFNYQKLKIPANAKYPATANIVRNQYQTVAKTTDGQGNKYLTGYVYVSEKYATCFVTKINAANKTEWVKSFKTAFDANDFGMLVSADNTGCYIVITSKKETDITNTLLRIDNTGKEISRSPLDSKLLPRTMFWDEISEKLFIAYKGTDFNWYASDSNAAYLAYYNTDCSLVWSRNILFTGTIVSVLKSETDFVILCNYTAFTENGAKKINKQNGGVLKIRLNENNESIIFDEVPANKAAFITHVIKTDNQYITLTGFLSALTDIQGINPAYLPKLYFEQIKIR